VGPTIEPATSAISRLFWKLRLAMLLNPCEENGGIPARWHANRG